MTSSTRLDLRSTESYLEAHGGIADSILGVNIWKKASHAFGDYQDPAPIAQEVVANRDFCPGIFDPSPSHNNVRAAK
jgi:hypothetical protein